MAYAVSSTCFISVPAVRPGLAGLCRRAAALSEGSMLGEKAGCLISTKRETGCHAVFSRPAVFYMLAEDQLVKGLAPAGQSCLAGLC